MERRSNRGSGSGEIRFEIEEHICTIAENESGWTKELNLVSWNGRPAKYDIRDWSPDHNKMSRGITLTADELQALKDGLEEDMKYWR